MKGIIRKTGITAGAVAVLIIVIYFASTGKIDTTPFFETSYYRNTVISADSLEKVTFPIHDSLYAGFARVNITPVLNSTSDDAQKGTFRAVPLAGYGDRKGKPAIGIHDSIYAKAAAIGEGSKTIIFIGADLLIMPPNIADTVAMMLKKNGIRRDQLFFTATHTHSSLGAWGPGFIGSQFAGKENRNLEMWLAGRIALAVKIALSDMKPSCAGSGYFCAGNFTRNRLIGDKGNKNDEFIFITIRQKGGRKAIIGSFSAHSTTLGDENMEISGDYPGYWERKMEKASADMAMFAAGSVGSQSPAANGNGFERSSIIGESLADSTVAHLKNVSLCCSPLFSAVSLPFLLPDYNMRVTVKRNLASFLSKKLLPAPGNVFLQAFRLGDLIWVTTPSDFSGEYAVQIKNSLSMKGFMSNISSFNGAYVGYIIPGRYFYLDKYESKLMGWFGPNMGDYTMDMINRITDMVANNDASQRTTQ
jgi:neutral ceramidase